MATCKKSTIDRAVTKIVKEEVFTLQMTRNEAESLRIVLQLIGGSPETSRRKFIEPIFYAMEMVDMRDVYESTQISINNNNNNNIYFVEEPWVKDTEG